jgi:hypothetical protein
MKSHGFVSKVHMTLVTSLAALLLPCISSAANHYVWCKAAGASTGADFANAYTALPSKLIRGDTYIVAGSTACSFGSHTFNDALSGVAVITVRYAQADTDSGVPGWQSSFATQPAQWDSVSSAVQWIFATGYYTMDGMVGSKENAGAYGFRLRETTPATPHGPWYIELGEGGGGDTVSTVTLRHIEIDGGDCCVVAANLEGKDIAINGPGNNTVSNVTMQYLYIHDWGGTAFQINNWDTILLEHSVIARNRSTTSWHEEAWTCNPCVNLTDRYNVYEDIAGTGMIVSGLSTVMPRASSNMQVYGDVFISTPACNDNGAGTGVPCQYGLGIVTDNNAFSNYGITGLQFYNNTIANISGGTRVGVFMPQSTSTITLAQNNLWWNCSGNYAQIYARGGMSHDYNTFLNTAIEASNTTLQAHEYQAPTGAANPFLSVNTKDFHISSETMAPHLNDGIPVALPFNTDMDGNVRGADGTWERGAFEFSIGVALKPPQNLSIADVK